MLEGNCSDKISEEEGHGKLLAAVLAGKKPSQQRPHSMVPMSCYFFLLLKVFELGCLAEQLIRDGPVSSLPETSVTLGHQVLRERQFVALCLVLFSLPPTFPLLAQDSVGDAGKKGEDRGKT